jgi:hypothetical protein
MAADGRRSPMDDARRWTTLADGRRSPMDDDGRWTTTTFDDATM